MSRIDMSDHVTTNAGRGAAPPRCLVAIGSLARGGAERQAILTVQALIKVGCDARLFVVAPPLHLLDEIGDQVIVDLPPSSESLPGQLRRLRKTVFDFAPDAVITFLPSASMRFLLARVASRSAKRAAWVVSERGSIRFARVLRSPAASILRVSCLREADVVVVNSASLAASVIAFVGSAGVKTAIVPNVLVPFTSERALARTRIQALTGLKDGVQIFGCVGSFQDDRNYELLATAFALLAQRFSSAHLVIIGRTTGPECEQSFQRFQSIVRELGIQDRIAILGEVPNARSLMAGFDIYLLPSKLEGSPNSLLEALIAGVPIVTTPVADAHALLAGAGAMSTGWTAAAFSAAVCELIADLPGWRARSRDRGLALLSERSPHCIGAMWREVVDDAIVRRRDA